MMEFLKGYIISVTVMILFLAFIDLILPDNNLKKYAKFVTGLIVIITILSPIFKFFDRKSEIETYILNYENDLNVAALNLNKKDIQNKMKLQTEQIFKEKLKESIEKDLYDSTKKRYKVIKIDVEEGIGDSIYAFGNIKYIELKLDDDSLIKTVDKVVIDQNYKNQDEIKDKEVIIVLQKKYNIEPSYIKIVK